MVDHLFLREIIYNKLKARAPANSSGAPLTHTHKKKPKNEKKKTKIKLYIIIMSVFLQDLACLSLLALEKEKKKSFSPGSCPF